MPDVGRTLHWLAGFGLGLLARPFPRTWRERRADALDQWAWEREWRQNLAGANPNDPMSEYQQDEARSWGNGFRRAAGIT